MKATRAGLGALGLAGAALAGCTMRLALNLDYGHEISEKHIRAAGEAASAAGPYLSQAASAAAPRPGGEALRGLRDAPKP